VEKALREAKLRTDWADSNEAYENAVLNYVRHLFAAENVAFLTDFAQALQPFIRAGLVNSFTQTVIKLTAPGVPDIYQGCEALDFSLVDPDNRREPDFTTLVSQLDADAFPDFTSQQGWLSGSLKQQMVMRLLHLRRDHAALFRFGDYQALHASGEHAEKVVAYARQSEAGALIVIAPRLIFADAQWADVSVALSETLSHRTWLNALNGETYAITDSIALENLNYSAPLVLLSS